MSAMYPQTHARLERCKFLWDEYKYRHDLIWQRVFRFTTAIVLISVIPYVQEDIARIFGPWIITAPLLASLLALFVLPVMCYELCLFNKIKKEYEEQQNRYLGKKLKDPGKVSLFEWSVMVYFVLLLALSIVNSGIALLVWIPRLLDRTACV